MINSKITYEVFKELFKQAVHDGKSGVILNFYIVDDLNNGVKLRANVTFDLEDMEDDNHL